MLFEIWKEEDEKDVASLPFSELLMSVNAYGSVGLVVFGSTIYHRQYSCEFGAFRVIYVCLLLQWHLKSEHARSVLYLY